MADTHRWQQWKTWGGVRGEGKRAFCQHCGMLRTMVFEAGRGGWHSISVPRYERGDFTQFGGKTPECVGIFYPLTIDGFRVEPARPLQDGETMIPMELQSQ